MKILIIAQGRGGVEYHRLLAPFNLLTDRFDISHTNALNPSNWDVLQEGWGAVVFSRLLCTEPNDMSEEIAFRVREAGARLIVDIDDHWTLHKGHQLQQSWKERGISGRILYALKAADTIWTTHDLLASAVGSKAVVIPNALDPTDPQWVNTGAASDNIGWFGSPAHIPDIESVAGSVRHWRRSNPSVLWLTPNNEISSRDYGYMSQILGGTKQIATQHVTNYGYMYDTCGIAFTPLADNHFNRHKSELKAIEAGMKGKAFVASAMHPYTLICNDRNSVTFKPSNLGKALDRVMDRSFREDIAAQLAADVRERYDLRKVNEVRVQSLSLGV